MMEDTARTETGEGAQAGEGETASQESSFSLAQTSSLSVEENPASLEVETDLSTQLDPQETPIPWLERIGYALPALALAITGIILNLYVPKLYTDTYGVSLKVIGSIAFVVTLADAVSDPIMGALSDATRSRFGRRRPYILLGGIGLSITGCGVLAPPSFADTFSYEIWAWVMILSSVLAATATRVPWMALGMELTAGMHNEKTAVFAVREVMYIVGFIIAAGLPLLVAIEDEVLQFRIIGAVLGVVSLVTTAVCVWKVKETRYASLPPRDCSLAHAMLNMMYKYARLFRAIYGSKDAWRLLLGSTIYQSATAVNAFMFAYFVEYVANAQRLLEVVLITYILCGVVFLPLWVQAQRWFEKHQLIRATMTLQSVALLFAYLLIGDGDVVLLFVIVALAGTCFACFSTFKFSMLGDIADLDEWDNEGIRREGEIQGLFDLCAKGAAACFIGASVFLLDAAGYVPNQPQEDAARNAIRVAYCLFPSLMGFLSVLVIWPYSLTKAKHASAREEWDKVPQA